MFIKIASSGLLHGSSNYLRFPGLGLLEQLSPTQAPKRWLQAESDFLCASGSSSLPEVMALGLEAGVSPYLSSFLLSAILDLNF